MEENPITDDKILIQLLKKLSDVQAQLSAAMSTSFERHTIDEIRKVIDKSKRNVEKDSKRYGQDPNEASSSIEDLSESLEEARNEYSNEKNFWLIENCELQKDEFKKVIETRELQTRIKELQIQLEALEGEPKKQEEVRRQIQECESRIQANLEDIEKCRESEGKIKDNIDSCMLRCTRSINEASEEKGLLPVSEKTSFFSQIISRIKDKIGGKDKFKKFVIIPIRRKSTFIRDVVISNAHDEIIAGIMPQIKELYIPEGSDNLSDMIASHMKIVKDGAPVIVENGSKNKNYLISDFSKNTITQDEKNPPENAKEIV